VRVRRTLTLGACCGVHALQDGLIATLYVLLPTLAQTFGLTYAQVGFIRASSSAAMATMELPSGMLSERLGERTLLGFGLLLAGIGYLALGEAQTFVAGVASLLLAGAGAAFQHALSSSIISHTFETARRRAALGAYNSAGDAGKLAFTALFSLAVGIGWPWQDVVRGYGVTALVAGGALLVLLARIGVGHAPRRGPGQPARGEIRRWGVRDRGGFAALVVIVFLDIAVQSAFLTFLAFLMLEKQVPAGLAGVAVVLTLAGGMLGKLGCGFLAERFGPVRSLILVECLTAAGIVSVLLAPTLLAYCLLPVVGLVLQGSSSITYATVADLIDSDRHSRGFATIYSVSSVASIAGPLAVGAIGDALGLSGAMLAMALAVLLPVPLCVRLRPALAAKGA
jgi:MFS transporter, FSR family, fosmidomycin resistance protein